MLGVIAKKADTDILVPPSDFLMILTSNTLLDDFNFTSYVAS